MKNIGFNKLCKITFSFVVFWSIISCQNEEKISSISSRPISTIAYDDTTILNLAGYYHNLILDSLIRLHSSIPDSTLAIFFNDNAWLYQNLFVLGYDILKGLSEFQNVEIDTNGGYNFVTDFKSILCDTSVNFEESSFSFLQYYCQNDTLVNIIRILLEFCRLEDYQTKLDSLLNTITMGNYSTYIKYVVRIGVSVGKSSMDYWINYNSTGIYYKYKEGGDKVLLAPWAAIGLYDLICGVASVASDYIGGERDGWKIAGRAAIGAVVGSAGIYIGIKIGGMKFKP